MKPHVIPTAAALLLTLLVAGCESDGGIAARTKEKSAVFATLKQWEKNYIAKGIPAVGFTPDMVYIAMGHPSLIEPMTDPDGKKGELWTYKSYYPNLSASEVQTAKFSKESAYQPQPAFTYKVGAKVYPIGQGPGQTIGQTGGPQGGSMEPADLPSYTFHVLFTEGKVNKIAAEQNP